MVYDVIIVGAGPAGLNAGYHAAKHDVKVLILDKKQEIGKPVRCGEATIENVFRDFGIPEKPELISNVVNKMKCYSSGGKKFSVELNINGYILNRVGFEQYLAAQARNQGAEIQLNTTVIGANKNGVLITKDHGKTKETISGKIIIAADGVESRVGRWSGINTTLKPRDIAVCYQYVLRNVELEKNAVEFYWGRKYSPHGYIWVFPKSKDSANVGIVALGSNGNNLKSLLDKFILERAPDSEKISQVAGCVPQALPPKRLVKDNVILIGDAARVSLPVTGAGIGHALVSGKWAGDIAGNVIRKKQDLTELTRFEKTMIKIRRKIKRSYLLKEQILKDDEIFELLFGLFIPLRIIYMISPKFIEKFLLKSIRY